MKNNILLLVILYSFALNAQELEKESLVSFSTVEKNTKEVVISAISQKENKYFLLSAQNKTNKEYRKCYWELSLTQKRLQKFIAELDAADHMLEDTENTFFKIDNVKKGIKVKFLNTKCSYDHKTHYFQKSCNRQLTFIVTEEQKLSLIDEIYSNMYTDYVKR
tara:strand:+ start:25 stop:513 length:489 start_codon:yes stop_codon:yes gene_type:complete